VQRLVSKRGFKWTGIFIIVIAIFLTSASIGLSQTEEEYSSLIGQVDRKAKLRIGYVEGEPFVNYAGTFYYLIKGLEEKGWLHNTKNLPYEKGQEDSFGMWQWLAESDTGPFIEFIEDAHYSLSDPEVNEEDIFKRLEQKDLDLLIVMGTKAGQAMTKRVEHQVPILVFSVSNAVRSNIIKSEFDSGTDNIWAHVDSGRFRRQIEVFYDIFNFTKLGMVYEDSHIGRTYAAIGDVEEVSKENGFDVIEEHVDEWVVNDEKDRERYYREVLRANRKLAEQVDAMYLTIGNWEPEYLPTLLEPFYEKNIPVFSQQGSNEVMYGALLSLYRADFSGIGRFGAETIIKVIQGESPRSLPQTYGDAPGLVINLKVAELIEYQIPFEILLVADEIFLEVGNTD